MKAVILAVGDELLSGAVLDAHGPWLSQELTEAGAQVVARQVVPDQVEAIAEALRGWSGRADLGIVTGGLGPTADDLTLDGVAQVLSVRRVVDPDCLTQLESLLQARGRGVTENQRRMVELPEGVEAVSNPVGAAPGIWFEVQGCRWLVLPGVPSEMRAMFGRQRERLGLARDGARRSYRFVGVTESALDAWISSLELPEAVKVGFRNVHHENEVKLWAYGPDAVEWLEQAELRMRERPPGRWVRRPLEEATVQALSERGEAVAVAESCTGGMLMQWMTSVPGSSKALLGGVVAYANQVKVQGLGVSPAALERHGAVSETVARQMAEGVRERFDAQWGLSTTGVAGPGGGTDLKPVGTVWIGIADCTGSGAVQLRLRGDREGVRIRTVQELLIRFLDRLGATEPPTGGA